jgi:hypothetical protein
VNINKDKKIATMKQVKEWLQKLGQPSIYQKGKKI